MLAGDIFLLRDDFYKAQKLAMYCGRRAYVDLAVDIQSKLTNLYTAGLSMSKDEERDAAAALASDDVAAACTTIALCLRAADAAALAELMTDDHASPQRANASSPAG